MAADMCLLCTKAGFRCKSDWLVAIVYNGNVVTSLPELLPLGISCLKRQDLASFVRDEKIIQLFFLGLVTLAGCNFFLSVLLIIIRKGWW